MLGYFPATTLLLYLDFIQGAATTTRRHTGRLSIIVFPCIKSPCLLHACFVKARWTCALRVIAARGDG